MKLCINKNFATLTVVFISLLSLKPSFVDAGFDKHVSNNIKTPNFIIIYVDDMGYSDVGKFSDGLLKTPNIDRLAKFGQTWTNFYSAGSVCTPSRGAVLTGKLPISSGIYGDKISVFFPGSSQGIPSELITLPEILQQNNYSTGLFGKWHLGDMKKFYPTRHGFDKWVGIPYSNDMDWNIEGITSTSVFVPWKQSGNKWNIVSKDLREKIFSPKITDWNVPMIRSFKGPNDIYIDEIIEKPFNQNLATMHFTNEAVEFIKEADKTDRNFFVFLSHSMPHVPLFVSKEFEGKSNKGIYGDVIQEIDWSVGEVLKILQSLDLQKETYVIFTSDNGPWLSYLNHAGTSLPLRDGKGTTFEGGMRVTTYFYGADVAPGEIGSFGVQTDIFETFLSLASIKSNKNLPNSIDLSNTLKKKTTSDRNFVPYFSGSELRAFRVGNQKLHFITEGAFGAPPLRKIHEPPIVIDLETNISEDLSKSRPIENSSIVLNEFNKFMQSVQRSESIIDKQFDHLNPN